MTSLVPALALFAFVASVTPGPNNVLLLASGVKFGFVRTIPHIAGITVGVTLMILATGSGLARILVSFPVLSLCLKAFGVVYFLQLAYKLAHSGAMASSADVTKPFSAIDALLFQFINPKAWLFATTACTTYLVRDAPYLSLVVIAATFAVVNVPSIAVWAAFGIALRRLLSDPRAARTMNIAMAMLLILSLYPVLVGGDISELINQRP